MSLPQLQDFDVDLIERLVRHKPSGIEIEFYEYPNEEDWRRSDSALLRDNPIWPGDRYELACLAKQAAVAAGMKAQKPAR
ncbi:MAG TPA: hypothetical protein VGM07_11715 [Stellaceae bacterium]|jgi:hypothetical protein